MYPVEVDYLYENTPGYITVNYVSDGTQAWVSLPAQEMWPGAVVTPEQADKWLLAPEGTVAAFKGEVAPVTIPVAPPETEPVASSGSSSGGTSVGLVVAVVVGAAAVIALIVLGLGRRRESAGSVDDGRR